MGAIYPAPRIFPSGIIVTSINGGVGGLGYAGGTGQLVLGSNTANFNIVQNPNPDFSGGAIVISVDFDSATFATTYQWTSKYQFVGNGSPEAAVTAPVGSIFQRKNGGTSTTLYIKETGSGNTGWVAVSAGGDSGDMTKAVYDPQNAGKISGLTLGAGSGGVLSFVGWAGNAGSINLDGGGGDASSVGGSVLTYAGALPGGTIDTHGGTAAGGSIDTHDGGGSIDTRLGTIQLGVAATRTTISGNATGPRAFTLPNNGADCFAMQLDTGWTAAASSGDKTDSVDNYSGAGIDGTMASALNLVSAGLGDALQQDEARIKELIHFCQALQTALVARILPNV